MDKRGDALCKRIDWVRPCSVCGKRHDVGRCEGGATLTKQETTNDAR